MKSSLLIVLALIGNLALAGNPPREQTEYIEKYKDVAIREMKQYGIPASITLAQGILESQCGKSYLATHANNHFGIKCHEDWDGKRVYRDDDRKNECFRSYKDADESFRDHSLFLKNRSRYAFLFDESPTNYKAWAKGLKKAGYATNRKYPELLIKIIEDNDLHKYDLKGYNETPDKEEKEELASYQINVSANRVKFVIAKEGDTFKKIAEATDKHVGELLRYNELTYDDKVHEGQIIYLQPKRKKADRDHKEYIAKEGDDMYSISQKFAIRLEKLYKMNHIPVGQQPKPGDLILLR